VKVPLVRLILHAPALKLSRSSSGP
jgi:hypothetical protein